MPLAGSAVRELPAGNPGFIILHVSDPGQLSWKSFHCYSDFTPVQGIDEEIG